MSHSTNRRIRAALFATAITAGVGGAAVIASGASAADAVSATAAATVDATDTTATSSTDSSSTDSSTTDSGTLDPAAKPARDPSQGGHQANGITETVLTGDTATSVTSAAQAAYPDATIERVETDAEGDTYEAHMVLADGSHITLKFDAAFNITSTDTGGPHVGGPAPAAATGA